MDKRRARLGVALAAAAVMAGCTSSAGTTLLDETTVPVATSSPAPASITSTPAAVTTAADTTTTVPAPVPYDEVPVETDDGWKTASLAEAGIDAQIIGEMLGWIYLGDGSPGPHPWPPGQEKYENIHGILIVKDGRLVFEEYFYGYRLDSRHNVASVTKSITSLLAGIAIANGDLAGVDERVLPFFPDLLPARPMDERVEDITVADLLTMRHGWDCDDWDPGSPTYYLSDWESRQADLVAATLALPVVAAPGTDFSYCSASSVVLGEVISRVTALSIPEYADQVLFSPLGIETALWSQTPGGWTDTGGSLQLRPRDMARLGLLMLQEGGWDGVEVVPAEWIEVSVREHVRLAFNETWGRGYGYLWWLSEVPAAGGVVRSFAASGAGGQVIAVFPELAMVVVLTGGNYDTDEGQPFEIMDRFILPAVVGG